MDLRHSLEHYKLVLSAKANQTSLDYLHIQCEAMIGKLEYVVSLPLIQKLLIVALHENCKIHLVIMSFPFLPMINGRLCNTFQLKLCWNCLSFVL